MVARPNYIALLYAPLGIVSPIARALGAQLKELDSSSRVTAGFVVPYALAYAGLWLALLTPAMITLALRIRQLSPEHAAESISLVLWVGALVALISNPVFGALSDRTQSRFGRRRPWLAGGALGGLAALTLIGYAPSLGTVLIGWCLTQLAFNAALAAIVAVLADQVSPAQRGTVTGILGVCMPIGQISGTFLVQQLSGDLVKAFALPGALGTAAILLLAIVLREQPLAPTPASGAAEANTTPALLAPRRHHPNFWWAWLSRVFFVMGITFLTAYQPYFLLEELQATAADVPALIFRSTLVQAGMVVASSLAAGRLSDRFGNRKPFVIAGSVAQAVGLWLIATADSYTAFLFAVAIVGIGQGSYEGVDLAMVSEVLPDARHQAAKGFGLLNITNTLPQVIAPLAAPAILELSRGRYTPLFVVAGGVAMLGALSVLPLKNAR